MRFNPKPTPRPPPKRPVSQKPSPTRNYFPPGVNQQVHFNDGDNMDEKMGIPRSVLKQQSPMSGAIVL